MIKKGILFGKEDMNLHLYGGFYDEKVKDKTEFIQLIKKICGEYTDCWTRGKTINLFDSDFKEDIMTKEGITVVCFDMLYKAFENYRHRIFRENPEAVGRFEALRGNLRKIRSEMVDSFPTEEQKKGILTLKKETEKKYSEELASLGGMERAMLGDYLSNTLPDTLPLKLNFLERIERTAKETGLEHLIALPLFGRNKDAGEDNIWVHHTTGDDVWMLLEKARKKEPLYTERLYIGYPGPEKDKIPTKILERTLSILK